MRQVGVRRIAIAAVLLTAATPATPVRPTGTPAIGPQQPPCVPALETLPGAVTRIYADPAGRPLRIHLFLPPDIGHPRPAILFFFGGGWSNGNVGQFQDQAKALRDRGYVAAIADYRVFCRDRTSPVEAVADAQAAFHWLRAQAGTFGIDPARIVLSGGSAGGHLAAMAAIREPVASRPAALVLFNPVVNLTLPAIRTSVRLDDAGSRALSPAMLRVDRLPPTILFHGSDDRIVPVASARAWCDAIRAKGGDCRFEEYPGHGHGFFNQRRVIVAGAPVPYDDTMRKTIAFLAPITREDRHR